MHRRNAGFCYADTDALQAPCASDTVRRRKGLSGNRLPYGSFLCRLSPYGGGNGNGFSQKAACGIIEDTAIPSVGFRTAMQKRELTARSNDYGNPSQQDRKAVRANCSNSHHAKIELWGMMPNFMQRIKFRLTPKETRSIIQPTKAVC